jgi:hypothetical protein
VIHHCVLLQNDVQAQARCHRIGQTKEVKVYRLITGKTYEQKMFERASMKLGLDQAVLTNMRAGMESSKNAGQLGKKDIDALLKFGAYDIFKDDDEAAKAFVEQDIESILSTRSTVLVSKVDTHALEHGSTFRYDMSPFHFRSFMRFTFGSLLQQSHIRI